MHSPAATLSPSPPGNRQRPKIRYWIDAGRPTGLVEVLVSTPVNPAIWSARVSDAAVKCVRCRGTSR